MKTITGLVLTFLIILFLMLLPYGVYYWLASNVDIREGQAENIGLSVYGFYILTMITILANAIRRKRNVEPIPKTQ